MAYETKSIFYLSQKMTEATLKYGSVDATLVEPIDQSLKQLTVIECKCAAAFAAAMSGQSGKGGQCGKVDSALCQGLFNLRKSKRKLIAALQRLCGLLAVALSHLADLSGTVSTLIDLSKSYAKLAECMFKIESKCSPCPDCVAESGLVVSHCETDLASSVDGIKSRACCSK